MGLRGVSFQPVWFLQANTDLKFPQLFYLHSTRVGLVNAGGLYGLHSSEF